MGRFDRGSILVMLDRGDYWQCAYVIAKGSAETLKAAGIEKFRERIVKLMPFLADRVHELATVDDLKLLTVGVERLEKWWKPGLLCIGDAAHTMSPIGGVGVNIAVQDAVAAANILAGPLKEGRLKDSRSRGRAGAPPVAGARHPGDPGVPAEPHDRADARRHAAAAAAVAGAPAERRAVPAPHPRPRAGHGRAARAREDEGGLALLDAGRRLGLADGEGQRRAEIGQAACRWPRR